MKHGVRCFNDVSLSIGTYVILYNMTHAITTRSRRTFDSLGVRVWEHEQNLNKTCHFVVDYYYFFFFFRTGKTVKKFQNSQNRKDRKRTILIMHNNMYTTYRKRFNAQNKIFNIEYIEVWFYLCVSALLRLQTRIGRCVA